MNNSYKILVQHRVVLKVITTLLQFINYMKMYENVWKKLLFKSQESFQIQIGLFYRKRCSVQKNKEFVFVSIEETFFYPIEMHRFVWFRKILFKYKYKININLKYNISLNIKIVNVILWSN